MLALKILQVLQSKAIKVKNLRWIMCQTSFNITELPYLKNNYKNIPLLPPRKKTQPQKTKGEQGHKVQRAFWQTG